MLIIGTWLKRNRVRRRVRKHCKMLCGRERSYLHTTTLALLICFFNFGTARASVFLTANFDDLGEGSEGSSFSDGGITFSDIDERIPDTPGGTFDIEATTATLPGFSAPNYLTFEGYVPGLNNGYGFGRFGSADIGFSGTATSASMDIFGFGKSSTNTLTLEALLAGTVVDTDTVTFQGSLSTVLYRPLAVSGTFDSLQLVSAGTYELGTSFFGMDNVRITIVPEPSAAALLGCGLAGIAFRRLVSKRTTSKDLAR